jgi:hypothetical protein
VRALDSTIKVSTANSQGNSVFVKVNTQYDMGTSFRSENNILYPPASIMNKFLYSISTDDTIQIGSFVGQLVSCPTGFCGFPTYQTLAVRTQCVDLSSQVKSGSVVSHPTNPHLTLGSNSAINSSTDTMTPPAAMYDEPVGLLLARWYVIGQSVGASPAPGVTAAECVFYWAVNTYVGNVTDASFQETGR